MSVRDRRLRPESREVLPERPGAASLEDALADRNLARTIVGQVPEKLRAPAWLYHVEGMEQEEVAKVLGISRRTVVTRLGEFAERARTLIMRTAA